MGSKTAIMLWRLQVETPYNPFRYCGEYYDDETDLIYLRNRYYDNQTGRFITEDPIKDGLNWYAYCGNNPINNIDPLGLSGIKKDGTYYITHRLDGRLLDLKKEYLSATTDEQRAKIAREAQKIRNSGKEDVDWSVRADKTLDYYMIDTDVTQKLNKIMVEAEKENSWKRWGEFTGATNILRYANFYSIVKDGAKYDLKSKPEWQGKRHYIYEGKIIDYDSPGNILYGYLGKSMGFEDDILLVAAGAAQILDNTSSFKYISSYFDDPRDQVYIKLGIQKYKNTHSWIWW